MRLVSWLPALLRTIEQHRALPFRWAGRDEAHDCCTFAAACIDAMTGSHKLDALLANYHDRKSAIAYIAHSGGLAACLTAHLGQPKEVSRARTGDVVIHRCRGLLLVGICVQRETGEREIVSPSKQGLVTSPIEDATLAWSV